MRTNRNNIIPFSEKSATDIFLPGPRFVRKLTIGAGLFILMAVSSLAEQKSAQVKTSITVLPFVSVDVSSVAVVNSNAENIVVVEDGKVAVYNNF